MKNWSEKDEASALEEYLVLIPTFKKSDEFENTWTGIWDDFYKESFGKRKTLVKGDKHKFMKYWIENQKIINDDNWDKIDKVDEYGDF